MPPADVMNAQDVARYLRLSKNTVYALAKSGQLASYRVGRKLRFSLEDVQAYVDFTHTGIETEHASNAVPHETSHAIESGVELAEAASFGMLSNDPFILEGEDPAGDVIAAALRNAGVAAEYRTRTSYTALVDLYAGKAHAAIVHLYNQRTNSYNVPAVHVLAPGSSVLVYRLYAREQGFIVQAGNPKHLTSWGGLLREGVRLVNRAKGSGARILLDEKLRDLGALSESIDGYETEAASPQGAIKRVAEGLATVAIGTRREAQGNLGVQFVPLQQEWVDMVIVKSSRTRPLITNLEKAFANQQLQNDFAILQPTDLGKLGAIIYEN